MDSRKVSGNPRGMGKEEERGTRTRWAETFGGWAIRRATDSRKVGETRAG